MNTGLYPYLFKTGTFWVYKNQTTGAVDSEYVYSYVHDIVTYPSHMQGASYCGDVSGEEWEYWCFSFINGVLIDTSQIGGTDQRPGEESAIVITNNFNFNFSGQGIFLLGIPTNYNSQGLYYKGILPSLTVNSYTYYQVQQFYLDISQSSSHVDSANAMLYYATHVGLIRKTIYANNNSDSVNWDLINKHIVQ